MSTVIDNVENIAPYIQYVAGSGQTVYPYPFPITTAADIVVEINAAVTGAYSLSGIGNDTGGNVTLNTGSTAGDIVTIYRDIEIVRATQIPQNGGFSSAAFNAEFNRIYLIMQQIAASNGFALSVPDTNYPVPQTVLTPAAYANKYLSFDQYGNPQPAALVSGTITASIINALTNAATLAEIALGVTPTNDAYLAGNVLRYGAVGDNSTDNTTAINTAIAVMAASGGGVVTIPPYGTLSEYSHSGTIVQAPNVTIIGYGATLNYTGTGIQIGCPAAGTLNYAGIFGLCLNFGNATISLHSSSAFRCLYRDIVFNGNSQTVTCIQLDVNTTGTANPEANYNGAFSQFMNIVQTGVCGTGILISGNGPTGGPPIAVNTLHTFHNTAFEACALAGHNFGNWCDSNKFSGIAYVQIYGLTAAATAYGAIFNSFTPSGNVGVYDIHYDYLAVDYFGTGTNVVGVQLEECATITIEQYFGPGLAGGRDLQVSSGCYSYDIKNCSYPGTNNIVYRQLGVNYAIGGAVNLGVGIYTSQFTLSGTSQASAQFSDTFSGTVLNQGVTVSNSLAANVASGAYYGVAVGNLSKGSGASVTNNVGIYVYDQTAGSTSNYGIDLNVSAGSGKFNIYAGGTAANFFAGPMSFGTYTAGTVSQAGYITITDSSGTTRRLLVG